MKIRCWWIPWWSSVRDLSASSTFPSSTILHKRQDKVTTTYTLLQKNYLVLASRQKIALSSPHVDKGTFFPPPTECSSFAQARKFLQSLEQDLFRHGRGKNKQRQGHHAATSWCKDASNSRANNSRNASNSTGASNCIDKGKRMVSSTVGKTTVETHATAGVPATAWTRAREWYPVR